MGIFLVNFEKKLWVVLVLFMLFIKFDWLEVVLKLWFIKDDIILDCCLINNLFCFNSCWIWLLINMGVVILDILCIWICV